VPDFTDHQRKLADELRIDISQLDAEPEPDPEPEREPRRYSSAPRQARIVSGRRVA